MITDVSHDLRVTLTDGSKVDIDLSGLQTVQDVLAAFNNADPRLMATINPRARASTCPTQPAGAATIAISSLNGSSTADDLGLRRTPRDARAAPRSTAGASSGAAISGSTAASTTTRSWLLRQRHPHRRRGHDSIVGNGGTDTLVESFDADMTLTDSGFQIAAGAIGTYSLSGISPGVADRRAERPHARRLGVHARGASRCIGGTGNDAVLGGSGDDILTGGGGVDSLDGGGGFNTEVETADGRFVLSGNGASADPRHGPGDRSARHRDLHVHRRNLHAHLRRPDDRADRLGRQRRGRAVAARLALEHRPGQRPGAAGPARRPVEVLFWGNLGGKSLTVPTATGGVTVSADRTQGQTVYNQLKNIQAAQSDRGASDNLMDASGFAGQVSLFGRSGDDTLIGGNDNDLLDGGTVTT